MKRMKKARKIMKKKEQEEEEEGKEDPHYKISVSNENELEKRKGAYKKILG